MRKKFAQIKKPKPGTKVPKVAKIKKPVSGIPKPPSRRPILKTMKLKGDVLEFGVTCGS